MAVTHVFPQTGDNDDAENFAQLIGQSNLNDFVETGMALSADYTGLSVSIADGLAFIGVGSQSASSTGETRLSTTMAVQMASATKSLTDSDVNHVYVEPNIGTDDSASYAVYTNTSNASANALKIGEVDTSANTTTEMNRETSLEQLLFGDYQRNHDGGTVTAGNAVPLGTFSLADGDTLQVTQAHLTADGLTTAVASGVELVIATENDTATSGPSVVVLSGDGTTAYVDETGYPGVASYQNTTGAQEAVVVAIDNGNWNTGNGADQDAFGGFTGRVK